MSDRQTRPGSGPRNADQVAFGAGDQLTRLWRSAARLQRLATCVRAALPPPLAERVQVVSMQGGVLTLMVESAAWGTRLRLTTADLQRALASLPEFTPLERIRVKIATTPDSP